MTKTEVKIPTPDGDARAFIFHPDGEGPWPAVIFFMDAPAIRPALFSMCERLAGHGYFVLLPDMFWRAGPYEPINITEAMKGDEARRADLRQAHGAPPIPKAPRATPAPSSTGCRTSRRSRPSKVGVTGYCMGGGLALRAAGTFPDRIAAAAAFHGGRLATDAPDSPHLLAPKIKAKVYVAGADEDAGFPPEQADRLRDALTAAGVDNTVEIYAGARHGYAPPDMPVYNEAAAERHWREMLKLFDETLK